MRRIKNRLPAPLLVSCPEFARLSGLGEKLVRRMVSRRELPTSLIGARRWIIRDKAVAQLRKQVA
jgi:hypothetical protein